MLKDGFKTKLNDLNLPQLGCGEYAEFGIHKYSERTCPNCGRVFCWNCCANSNAQEGSGRYGQELFTDCPQCGYNVDEVIVVIR